MGLMKSDCFKRSSKLTTSTPLSRIPKGVDGMSDTMTYDQLSKPFRLCLVRNAG